MSTLIQIKTTKRICFYFVLKLMMILNEAGFYWALPVEIN